MKKIAKFVVDHKLLAWTLLLLFTITSAWLVSARALSQLEQARLVSLKLDVEKQAIQLMSQTLNGNQMGAIGLLGLIDENAKLESLGKQEPNKPETVQLLRDVTQAYNADGVGYVGQDRIIKSSWGAGKPLTGIDVTFRPYIQMALKGKENVYAAIGSTTGRRTLYYATPVYASSTKNTPVIGAVFMRTGVVQLDKQIAAAGDIGLLFSPQGIVFAASRDEWIGHTRGQFSATEIAEIRRLKQFGTMFDGEDPSPLPFSTEPGITTVNGVRHAVTQSRVAWNDPYGDWTMVAMEDLSRTVPISGPLQWGGLTGMAMLIFGWLIIHLLRGSHARVLADEQLEAYSKAKLAAAERKTQLAKAALRMQQSKNPSELIQTYLDEAHHILGSLQGSVYILAGTTLRLGGHYACAEMPPASLNVGEGLLGQCATDRRLRVIETVPHGFATIRSGLGVTPPVALIMAPILLNDNLLGVVELALLVAFDVDDQEQFEELTGILALDLEIFSRNTHTDDMLGKMAEGTTLARQTFATLN